MIDPNELREVFKSCLFEDDEDTTSAVMAYGIITDAGFHPGRLDEKREIVKGWLDQLPDEFHVHTGGGMSFLNACMTKDGNHWGEHQSVELLFLLGMAMGYVTYPLPRELWDVLPGGMPYYTVDVSSEDN